MTTYRLTRQRIAKAAEWTECHTYHLDNGQPFVPDASGIPDDVSNTLTRIYGPTATSYMGETAYWIIDDGGAALGIEVG